MGRKVEPSRCRSAIPGRIVSASVELRSCVVCELKGPNSGLVVNRPEEC